MAITKKYWTYAELRDKVRLDLDLKEETFITDEEMLGYTNQAIDDAEKDVMTLYEDYYLDKYDEAVVSGTERYTLPPNIYANKIRRVVFRANNQVYKVGRIPDWHKFEIYALDRVNSASGGYNYFLINSTPGQPEMLVTPVPAESGTFEIWYTRQANRLEGDSDILDIEEAHNFVMAYMRYRCIFKEVHGANTAGLMAAKSEMEAERATMISSLAARVPDADNEIELDVSSYEEMS